MCAPHTGKDTMNFGTDDNNEDKNLNCLRETKEIVACIKDFFTSLENIGELTASEKYIFRIFLTTLLMKLSHIIIWVVQTVKIKIPGLEIESLDTYIKPYYSLYISGYREVVDSPYVQPREELYDTIKKADGILFTISAIIYYMPKLYSNISGEEATFLIKNVSSLLEKGILVRDNFYPNKSKH